MTPADFARGISRIALACGKPLDDAVIEVYFDALAPQVMAEEWELFTRQAVASGRFRFFPTVAEILDALQEHRHGRSVEAEATEAYERVLACGTYTPQGGTCWSPRDVRERCGRAAMEAFLAAGGHHAFVTTWEEAKRRDKFLREYMTVVRADPTTRLLPAAAGQKALPAGEPAAIESTADEAPEILGRIAGLADLTRKMPAARMTAEEWESRRAELLRQAKVLSEEEHEKAHADEVPA